MTGSSASARCNWWRQKDEYQSHSLESSRWLLWLVGLALFAAQAYAQNSIENFEVSQQAGKTVVRITTKEPLKSVPPNFSVAKPARIAFDFPNTANALGRSSQDIGQGELRSMNVVQGADRTRLVLNLRRAGRRTRPRWTGNTLVITLAEAAGGVDHARRRRGALRRGQGPTPSTRCATSTSAAGAPARAASWWISPTPPPASTSACRARTSSSSSSRPRCPRACAAASTWSTSARRSTP